MYLSSTPALRASASTFLTWLSCWALAMLSSLSRDPIPRFRTTSSGATLISADHVTEISRGRGKESCVKDASATMGRNAETAMIEFRRTGDTSSAGICDRWQRPILAEVTGTQGASLRSADDRGTVPPT